MSESIVTGLGGMTLSTQVGRALFCLSQGPNIELFEDSFIYSMMYLLGMGKNKWAYLNF